MAHDTSLEDILRDDRKIKIGVFGVGGDKNRLLLKNLTDLGYNPFKVNNKSDIGQYLIAFVGSNSIREIADEINLKGLQTKIISVDGNNGDICSAISESLDYASRGIVVGYLPKSCLTPKCVRDRVENAKKKLKIESPYLLVISGHTFAGKTTFKDLLLRSFAHKGFPIRYIINYKMREERPDEKVGIDYMPIDNEKHARSLEKEGKLFLYYYNNKPYGLSADVVSELQKNNNVVVITSINGLEALQNRIERQGVLSKVVPILLFAGDDALKRFPGRWEEGSSEKQALGIVSRYTLLEKEIERYLNHENKFRYTFLNPNVKDKSAKECINDIVERFVQSFYLDKDFFYGVSEKSKFRQHYIDGLVQRLFGCGLEEAASRVNKDELTLKRDEDAVAKIKEYEGNVEAILKLKVCAIKQNFGFLSFIFESVGSNKPMILSYIRELANVLPQSYKPDAELLPHSTKSLIKTRRGYLDFIASFSPSDQFLLPPSAAKPHTLVLETLYPKLKNIEIVEYSENEARQLFFDKYIKF